MKKSLLKARIRVLEARIRVQELKLETARASAEDRRECIVRAEDALREIGGVLGVMIARAVAHDKQAVGQWFAFMTITTPTLIMLAQSAKVALEANAEALRRFDEWTAGRS